MPAGISPPALRNTDAADVPPARPDTARPPLCAAAFSVATFESAAAICSGLQPALHFRESDTPSLAVRSSAARPQTPRSLSSPLVQDQYQEDAGAGRQIDSSPPGTETTFSPLGPVNSQGS